MRTISVLVMSVSVAVAAWGAPQRPAPAAPPAHQRAAAPAPSKSAASKPRLSDAQLEAAIKAKFAKSKSAPEHFTVHVQGGVATIEGKTDVVQHKGSATRMAKTAGAIAVNNHIEVSEAARDKASESLEKGRRRAQVKRGDSRGESRSSGQRSGGFE
ncbi:MAG TPA: BON domain-containing protein [Candidatus Limnocylindrales bacterium]|nr:BON domain-containing protein [Candidatus Limnocylindrales bacterium]